MGNKKPAAHSQPDRPTAISMVKKVYAMKELVEVVGRCRAAIYGDVRLGTFPKPIKIGPNSSRWLVEEVHQWLAQRAAERDRHIA